MDAPCDLDAIETRWKASTPGPWRLDSSDSDPYWNGRKWEFGEDASARHGVVRRWRIAGPRVTIESATNDAYFMPDMEFIAHAHQDIPHLIAELRRLRPEVAGGVA